MLLRAALFLSLSALLLAGNSWAGGSGLNVIVVVNQNSTNSVQFGNDYCELRGVPPQNLLRMTNWTGGSINWTPAQFQTELLNPLLTFINSRSLTQQMQYVVLSMDIPYRVTDGANENSTTSALFYGFKTNTPFAGGPDSCSLPDNSSNSYAYSELPFARSLPNTAPTNSFLAMMLTDTNLTAAENILHRAVASDSTFPTQTVYLAKTSDTARNVRFLEFDNSVFENQVLSNYAVARITTDSTAFTNLFGLLTGLANLSLNTNAFVPGSVGDSLTSFAGFLLENSGQTPLLAFTEAGASGSYGTVVEPCNYTQKFPDPVDYFYLTRGFSLAEAYYQSVLNPYEGVFVGEPLAAPFAHRAIASWTSLTNGAILSGQSSLNLSFTATAANLPLAQADLFIDGTYYQALTNLPPTAGNVLSVNVNGTPINYTVPTNASLATVATGMANALNLQSNLTQVAAFPSGDRIELQSLNVFTPGTNINLSASAALASASTATSQLRAARPAFLDTVATGYQVVTILNAPILGDWLQITFTKTNGAVVSFAVTNTVSGATVGALAQNLVNLINASPVLQSADGAVVGDFLDYDVYGEAAVQFFICARTPGWPASQIFTTLLTSTNLQATPSSPNPLADNVTDLRPRNHLYVGSGTNVLTINHPFDTTQIPDGYHQLTVVAYEGSSVATQTPVTRNVLVKNTVLSATFTASPAGTNAALSQTLQFTVIANTNTISRIELFSTGGSQGVVLDQASASFSVPASYLGLGLHPFYALVTDQSGHQFQTQTIYYRILPTINLTLAGTPPTLTWNTTPNRQYTLQFTTNLLSGFQTLTNITATNSTIQWPIVFTGKTGFYRVQATP